MAIRLQLVVVGTACRICALADDRQAPFQEFLDHATRHRAAEVAKLWRLLEFFAAVGTIHNPQKCRYLSDGMWEFKTPGGLRVFWFKDDQQLIICTNGYVKQRQALSQQDLARAEDWRRAYLAAKASGTISIEEDHREHRDDLW